MNNPQKILIEGPTAVGKTEISIELAKRLDTDIISADSRAFYKEMKIGTARPEINEGGVKHHFVGCLSLSEKMNVVDYYKKAKKLIDEFIVFKKNILVTGGSPLYVRSLLYGLTEELPPTPPEVRKHYQKLYGKYGVSFLYRLLRKIDPKRAQQLSPSDIARIMRALEIYRVSRKKMSSYLKKNYFISPKKTDYYKICLVRPRSSLYKRIEERVDMMIQKGLVEEARFLFSKYGYENPVLSKTIGYAEFIPYFKGEVDLSWSIAKIKTNSRRLAKRQLTWYRRENFFWIDVEEEGEVKNVVDKIINFIEKNPIN